MPMDNQSTKHGRFLEFCLGDNYFGIFLLNIREVIARPKTTPIPDAPSYFIGIMNLRGQIIPIIDLGKKLGISKGENLEESAVVIIEFNSLQIGILVDSVNRVLSPESEDMKDPPAVKERKDISVHKVFRSEDHIALILDLEKTFDFAALRKNIA